MGQEFPKNSNVTEVLLSATQNEIRNLKSQISCYVSMFLGDTKSVPLY